jgi:hypothetical protein
MLETPIHRPGNPGPSTRPSTGGSSASWFNQQDTGIAQARQIPLEVNYVTPLVLIVSANITSEDVTAFRQQANQKPSLITGGNDDQATMKIRLALLGDPAQTFVPAEKIQNWWEHTSVLLAAEILCRYFLQKGTMDIPIGEILASIPLVYNLANEATEDSTFINMEVALTNWRSRCKT